jgi:hypothetical protein
MQRVAANWPRTARKLQVSGPQFHNGIIAEWLCLESEKAEGHVARALRRAGRAAFVWPVEAAELVRSGQSLTILPAIGNLHSW